MVLTSNLPGTINTGSTINDPQRHLQQPTKSIASSLPRKQSGVHQEAISICKTEVTPRMAERITPCSSLEDGDMLFTDKMKIRQSKEMDKPVKNLKLTRNKDIKYIPKSMIQFYESDKKSVCQFQNSGGENSKKYIKKVKSKCSIAEEVKWERQKTQHSKRTN